MHWEYMVHEWAAGAPTPPSPEGLQNTLSDLGKQGWELVEIVNRTPPGLWLVLKRTLDG